MHATRQEGLAHQLRQLPWHTSYKVTTKICQGPPRGNSLTRLLLFLQQTRLRTPAQP